MEAVGQLAGGVAHDFNNILTATLMQLDLLRREEGIAAELDAALADLQQQARRAADLTRSLLLFSRRQVMQVRPIDLNILLDQMLRMLRRVLGETITIEFRSLGRPAWIEADPGMVEQVAMNLCVNARDAMPRGGRLAIAIDSVTLDEADARRNPDACPGRFMRLAVSDSGMGMDEATMSRIFEPFFSTKEPGKGTGLGLATAFGIVQQHRGWIEVESAPGAGTTFRVFFPAAREQAVADTEHEATAARIPGGTETILLVEDEASVRRLMVDALSILGYRVLEAADGPAAIRRWEEHDGRIDLLISDLVMPGGMSGFDVAENLRTRVPELKVIIISGYSAGVAARHHQPSGAVTLLQKPCGAKAVARAVRECLDGRTAQ